ncbi:AGE family epimerase/isomerase [Spirosoma oryzicola]|uniref:AGE family epimerase/isomerase n=1 Tax=Spirosoma oryzicola TaxID=2898794 RepID=UPI001E55F919|nr:AGE family epimerase/isomerase [Spirosoma oryzicola]UHG91437.1 AGE family epimerase/isomerase [Spirosoma oryzicola]
MLDFRKLSADYQQALLRQVVPFWLNHSRDEQCGGYFDFLTSDGQVIEGDKIVTLQAQQVWAFTWLYNTFDGQPAWLDHAYKGATFLSEFAHDEKLNSYEQLDRRGRPVAPAANVVASCSAVMAYAQLHRATDDDGWAMLAKQVFSGLFRQWETTHTELAQTIGGYRQLRHLGEPVLLLKTLLEIRPLLDEESWHEKIESVLHVLLREFLDRRTGILREYMLPDGSFINTPEGRRLNVGLTFQAANFLLDLCAESGNRKLAMQVASWCIRMSEVAWNELSGGLNQYADMKGQPLIFPDWNQRWAWVQVEALSALTKSYFQTHHPECPKWIKRIHDFTFQYFTDPKLSGWHLVIGQQNQPLLPAKAIATTGCFSLIRCLAETAQTLTRCAQLQPAGRHSRLFDDLPKGDQFPATDFNNQKTNK